MHHKIAIVGRPNVGKSTFFNKLIGKEAAIIDPTPGVTRDRKEGNLILNPPKRKDIREGDYNRKELIIIDTPGYEEGRSGSLESRMFEQTNIAINEASLIFFVVDGMAGMTPLDQEFLNYVRKFSKNLVLIVNKCENHSKVIENEFYKLNTEKIFFISAAHNQGMYDIREFLNELYESLDHENEDSEFIDNYLQIAFVGRPNAGKSTMLNQLIKQNRLLVSEMAGTTRDAITIDWQYKGQHIKLIDTAGLRKKAKVEEELEKITNLDSVNAIKYCNVAVLMLDAEILLEKQDFNILNLLIKEGRGLVIAINKCDNVEDKTILKKQVYDFIGDHFKGLAHIPICFISAMKGENIYSVIDEAMKVYKNWNKKISTGKLNAWLGDVSRNHPIPLTGGGKRPKLKYITQNKTRPPSFILFSNLPEAIPESYKKYLQNLLIREFDLEGVVARFAFRKTDNPYN